MYNENQYEETMNEKVIKYGQAFAKDYAELEDENSRLKDEIAELKTIEPPNKLNKLVLDKYLKANETIQIIVEELNLDTNKDISPQIKKHKEDVRSLLKFYEEQKIEIDTLKKRIDNGHQIHADQKARIRMYEQFVQDATIQRVRQDEYIKQMKDTTNGALNASSLSNQKYEDLRFKVAELLAYIGKTNSLDLTQRRMAEILGISESQLSRLVNRNN